MLRASPEGAARPFPAPADPLVLCLSLLVIVIDNTILNTALPTLARVLHAGTSSLQWITDAYTLCFAALLIPAGALGDRFGPGSPFSAASPCSRSAASRQPCRPEPAR